MLGDGGNELIGVKDLKVLLVSAVAHPRGVDDCACFRDIFYFLQRKRVANDVLRQCFPALFIPPINLDTIVDIEAGHM